MSLSGVDPLERIKQHLSRPRMFSGAAVPMLLAQLEQDIRWLIDEIERLRVLVGTEKTEMLATTEEELSRLQDLCAKRTAERDAARAVVEELSPALKDASSPLDRLSAELDQKMAKLRMGGA